MNPTSSDILAMWISILSSEEKHNICLALKSISDLSYMVINDCNNVNVKNFFLLIIKLIENNGLLADIIKCISIVASFVATLKLESNMSSFENFLFKNSTNISPNLVDSKVQIQSNQSNQDEGSKNKQKYCDIGDESTTEVECWKLSILAIPDELRPRLESTTQILLYLRSEWPKYIGGKIPPDKIPTLRIIGDSCIVFEIDEKKRLWIHETVSYVGHAKIYVKEATLEKFETFLMGSSRFDFIIQDDNTISIIVKTLSSEQIDLAFSPSEKIIYIGRNSKNDISVSDDSKISKVHASLSFRNGKWTILDNNSRNKVWRFLHSHYTLYMKHESKKVELTQKLQFSYGEVYIEAMLTIAS